MPPGLTFPNNTTPYSARRTRPQAPRRPEPFKTFLIVLACVSAAAGFDGPRARAAASNSAADSPATREARKRVLAVTGGDTADGSRLSVTADAPLDDYSSYVDGDRVFVLISQATLINAKGDARGRGFEEMRVEGRGDDVVLSFHLRQGATVRIGQNFNRLEITFYTNEHISKNQTPRDRP
jgi:hypothetical protein